ncbi:MAG: NAD(P)-dependent oxidoreductase [Chloroflexota bacterium]
MKVLIADQFEQSGRDGLADAGCDVIFDPGLKDEALAEALRTSGAEALIVRSTKVTADMMASPSLALIVRAGAGYNTIDVAAASAHGIYISNCPGRNSVAVAELALGLILSLDRRIPDGTAALAGGQWNKKEFSKAAGLAGRTLGLLGFGNIAQEVARRAQAFGMNLVIWSRRFEANPTTDLRQYGIDTSSRTSTVAIATSAEAVFDAADIVSIHLALAADTRGLVNADLLDRLKPGAILVNTARAEVVDHEALSVAVRERGLRVGLDVYPDEPTVASGDFDFALARDHGTGLLYGTHHIGASTEQAQEAIAAETVRIVRAFKETGRVPNVVNLARQSPATHMLVVRHRDRPGVLAHVFEQLHDAGINVQETENIVFEGAEAAIARINLDHAPTEDLVTAITEGNEHVLSTQLVAL